MDIPVVVATTFDLDEYVHTALANCASGCRLKDAGPTLLVEAAAAAIRRDALVSPSTTLRLLRHYADRVASRQPVEALTEREEEVLRAVAAGKTNTEVGEVLFISLATVKTQLSNLQRKNGARNRVELAAWAWETGRMGR